jgi:hypothetical protein
MPATASRTPPAGASAAIIKEVGPVIIAGIILLLIGFVAHIAILWTLGIIVLVVGAVFMLLGATGRAIGGRRHYY